MTEEPSQQPSQPMLDDISEISNGQETFTTVGTGTTQDPVKKVYRKAHELRLNLIYSGSNLLGMIFLCLHEFVDFLFIPAIIVLILHCILELRHDLVYKTRHFTHSRYTQASPNNLSYGGDLYLANLSQSWLSLSGMALFLLSVHLRADGFDFTAYKAIYFTSSMLIFLSGSTTVLSRGCGSFYFMGWSPGFSLRDQTANFLYVTSSVLFLIIASWQIDRGVFDRPLRICEYLIMLMWLVAAMHYVAADAIRLTNENPGIVKGASDATTIAATEQEQNGGGYVEMGDTAAGGKSSHQPPLSDIPIIRTASTGPILHNAERPRSAPLLRTASLNRTESSLNRPRSTPNVPPINFERKQSHITDASPSISSWSTHTSPGRLGSGPSLLLDSAKPTSDIDNREVLRDEDSPSTLLLSQSGTLGSLQNTSKSNGKSEAANPKSSVNIDIQGRAESPSTLSHGVVSKRSWKQRLDLGADPYCGMGSPTACTSDEDFGCAHIMASNPDCSPVIAVHASNQENNANWNWPLDSLQQAGQSMSTLVGSMLPQQSTLPSSESDNPNKMQKTVSEYDPEESRGVSISQSNETEPISNLERPRSAPPGMLGRVTRSKKKRTKNRTKYWGEEKEVV